MIANYIQNVSVPIRFKNEYQNIDAGKNQDSSWWFPSSVEQSKNENDH